MNQVRIYSAEEFDATIPEAESLPLRMMRQAIHGYRTARTRADHAQAAADRTPGNALLSRCAAHRKRLARAMLGQLAGAASAWTGRRHGRLFISDGKERDGFLCVAWGGGRPPAVREPVKYGADGPSSAHEILRLGERELLLAIGAVDSVVQDRAQRLLTHNLLISGWDGETQWHLASGQTIGAMVRSAAYMSEHRLRSEG